MESKKETKTTEFGMGLCYCLGLFLAHAERSSMYENKKAEEESEKRMNKLGKVEGYSFIADIWFNAASDHLYELQIPKNLPEDLKKRLEILRAKVIHFGHGFCNDSRKEDKTWAIEEAKELLRLIDNHNGIKTAIADWD